MEKLAKEEESSLKKPCPETEASLISKLFFTWFTPLTCTGYRRNLELTDIFDLPPDEQSSQVVPQFLKCWEKEKEKARNPFQVRYEKVAKDEVEIKPASILPALFKAFGGIFLYSNLLKLLPDMMFFLSPYLLKKLISFTTNEEESWQGILYAGLLFLNTTIITILYAHNLHVACGIWLGRVKPSLSSAIYRKCLKLSNSSKQETSTGEVVNLLSVDVQKIQDSVMWSSMVWSAPLVIIVALCQLWGILGPSCLAGLGVMLLIVPINSWIGTKIRKLQSLQLQKKDERVKLMNEMLRGMKILKLYAWEPSFEEKILKIRQDEIDILRKSAYFIAVNSFLWTCAPFLVGLATFATYLLVDKEHTLTADMAFVSLSIFNIMEAPLQLFPMMVSGWVQGKVSMKRINKFLNLEEMDPEAVTNDSGKDEAPILIEKATFSWERKRRVLRNINLKVKRGSLLAIVGSVGAGKSSLLSAILGELERISGRVNVNGRIAYVSQQPWIQNASLKDNILFGSKFDIKRYERVIEACALNPDLDALPAGDLTEIGEKGINLSGGQKQRVSLARAVYNNADIYLLDDPLSSVDAHVGRHLFEEVIGPKGILKGKTRVLVTHCIQYLNQVDQLIILKDGEIQELENYKEVLEHKNGFKTEVTKEDSKTEEKAHKSGQSKLIEDEKREEGSVKASIYLTYFRSAGWPYIFGIICLYTIYQVMTISSSVSLSVWTSQEKGNGTEKESWSKEKFLFVYTGFGIGQALAILMASFLLALATLKASATLHLRMLRRILRAPISFFDVTPSGRILNRFSRDVNALDTDLPLKFETWLGALFIVVGATWLIIYSTPWFILVLMPICVLYWVLHIYYVATTRQLWRLEGSTRSPVYSHLEETFTGTSTIRAFNHQERFIQEAEAKADRNRSCHTLCFTANRWRQIRLEIMGNALVFATALFAVLGRKSLAPGLVGLTVSYALRITRYLNILASWSVHLESGIVAVERLKEYSEIEQEAEWKSEEKVEGDWPGRGEVAFRQYQTRYRPGLDLVLKNVTFEIKAGEKIGVVGRTGAGKSSLTLALFRIIEGSGSIVVDGKDISRLGLHDLRGRITIIPQDPFLFSGTLRMNLDPFEVESTESLWQALEHAHLKPFVKSLEAGLDHEVAEGGENLSVGQKQLVCLARALLRKSKILVLDEATAAVDLETDELIQKTIKEEFRNSTVITIAHRLHTVMESDRIMVMENGEVREFDKAKVLLGNKKGIFYKMVEKAGLL